ncbi:MAG: S8 family serine peptidase, partial [Planctomycetes bacterium]|nr:S8 family serine peptidase [Planctomycetota bacterium]
MKWSCWTGAIALMAVGLSTVWSLGMPGPRQLQIIPFDQAQQAAEISGADRTPRAEVDLAEGETTGDKRVSILVHLQENLAREATERIDLKTFATQRGAVVQYEYKILPNVINLRNVAEQDVQTIANLPGVIKVERDLFYPNLINLHDSTPLVRGLQSQITGAGLSADGAGVRVAVCDTGIDSDHLMYASRIDTAAGRDFHNNDNDPEDDNGHGSHVSGIAVGGTGLTVNFGCVGPEPFQGIAPAATLIGVKILNQFGGGFSSNIIAGIDYAADQSPSGGRADVINLSIGTGQFSGGCTHSWAVAANNAVANGVVVVAASGNENFSNSLASPACGADVIAVGATYDENFPNCEDGTSTFNWGNCSDSSPSVDDIICFSNQSDDLDVAAPGCVTYSASTNPGGSTITGNCGTSMASPHVAGLAALILSADSSLTPAQVRQIIRDGAIDLGTPGFDRAYGHGRIDVIDSLNLVGPGCNTNGDCDDGDVCTTD